MMHNDSPQSRLDRWPLDLMLAAVLIIVFAALFTIGAAWSHSIGVLIIFSALSVFSFADFAAGMRPNLTSLLKPDLAACATFGSLGCVLSVSANMIF